MRTCVLTRLQLSAWAQWQALPNSGAFWAKGPWITSQGGFTGCQSSSNHAFPTSHCTYLTIFPVPIKAISYPHRDTHTALPSLYSHRSSRSAHPLPVSS